MAISNANDLTLDLHREPFSRRESRWAISFGRGEPCRTDRLYLRYIYAGLSTDLYRIDVDGGSDYQVEAHPGRLRLTGASGGIVDFVMAEPHLVRARGRGSTLTLTLAESISEASQWEEIFPLGPSAWNAIIRKVKHHLALLVGEAAVDAPWHPRSEGSHRHHRCSPFVLQFAGNPFELAIEDYQSEWEPRYYDVPFDSCAESVAKDFADWHAGGPVVSDEYAEAAVLASYVTWSAIVPAAGNFKYPTMLMSKRWMNNAWNWDNYFNAWASAYRDPHFALRQFHLHLDLQHEQGALGDGINEETIGWAYTKPPVHGWILGRMLSIHEYSDEILKPIYASLGRWTEWWFRYRDSDGDGVCQYHHGNDSGWDDASAFDVTPPVESPDLSALLVIQMEVLSLLADRFGRGDEAESWLARSKSTLDALVKHSWKADRFVAMQSGTHATVDDGGDSLLCQIPMILGRRLPAEQRNGIVSALSDEGRFLQPHGLSTESARSPHFIAEGYWRGPMWAPALMMIVDGLLDAGETVLAKDIARRFCDDCVAGGFAECYNPITGAPIHDPAYTWAASVFVILSQLF